MLAEQFTLITQPQINTVSSMLLLALISDKSLSLETLHLLVAPLCMEVYRDVARKFSMLFLILLTLKLILQPLLRILTRYAYVRVINISQIAPEKLVSASFQVRFSPFVLQLLIGASPLAGVVPGAIHAFFFSHETTLDSSQVTQISDQPYCYNFNYSVYGTEYDTVTLNLAPEPNFLNMLFGIGGDYMTIGVQLKECPAGFAFSNTSGSCVCEPSFERYNILCDNNDQSYVRPVNSWLGFINESSTELVVAFARNCPLGCCKPDVVKITLNTSSSQCEPHRTGLLCGKCDSEGGYSLTLGNGRCAMCSNTYLLLLFPLALAGLLLVVVLFALNLTVTEGSINGLIFYANVLSMSNAVQFSERGSQYLYTFLAWLIWG